MANSVDPDEVPHFFLHLIWVYSVCSGLSDQINTVKYNIWLRQTGKIMTNIQILLIDYNGRADDRLFSALISQP